MRVWIIVMVLAASATAHAEPGKDVLVPGNWVRTLRVGAMPVMQDRGTTWTIPMMLVVQDDYLGYDVGRDTIAGAPIDLLVSGFYRFGVRFALRPGSRIRPFAFGRVGLIFALNHHTSVPLNAGAAASAGLGVDLKLGAGLSYVELGVLAGSDNPSALTLAVGFGF